MQTSIKKMSDEFDLHIDKIDYTKNFNKQKKQNRKKPRKKKQLTDEEVKDHFDELTKTAEYLHSQLEAKNSPYRFCVYREGSEIFIDIAVLKENGNVLETIRKNITHQEFSDLIDHIEKLDGLLIDLQA